MRHAKPVRFSTAPTGGESVYLFLEFTISTHLNNILVISGAERNRVLKKKLGFKVNGATTNRFSNGL